MKRIRAQDALPDAPAAELQGREAVVLAVRSGSVAAAVPKGTADEAAIAAAGRLRGSLRLDNEQVLTFEIRAGASGASYGDRSAQLHEGGSLGAASLAGGRTAEQVMSRQVLTTSADELVEDVVKRLAFHNVSALPVEDWDGTIIGIVSELDVIDTMGLTVRDVMSHELVSVNRDTRLDRVAALMTERRVKRVPVLDGGRLVGIVSRADLVRAIAERSTVRS